MCCILYVPAGVNTPSIETLESVYLFNQHGCGYADADGNNIHTLNFREFTRHLQRRHKDAACIIHFRLATHGSINAKNCHPFYDRQHGIWFAHNGVLPIASHDDKTDSEIFFKEQFIPLLETFGNDYEEPYLWQFAEDNRHTSRFIFMRGDDVRMLGDWYKINGVYYSNLNWAYGYRTKHQQQDVLKYHFIY